MIVTVHCGTYSFYPCLSAFLVGPQVLEMEMEILKAVQFEIGYPTAAGFLRYAPGRFCAVA